MPATLWECPSCRRPTTITDSDRGAMEHEFRTPNADGEDGWAPGLLVSLDYVKCPNPKCRKPTLEITVRASGKPAEALVLRRLMPPSGARVLPDYVPEPVRRDYQEACDIVDRSPKAAATLARRALQGMIRDFHGIARDRLFDEVAALESLVDPSTWKSIDAVREIGNIGAHMEKDINIIVDVEPEEAELLISLIESLIDDWYITRHDREERDRALLSIAEQKRAERRMAATK